MPLMHVSHHGYHAVIEGAASGETMLAHDICYPPLDVIKLAEQFELATLLAEPP